MSARRLSFRPLSSALMAPLAAAFVLAGGHAPARAQIFGWFTDRPVMVEPSPGLPPAQIYRMLARQGYRLTGPLHRNNNVYLADVINRRGRQERLVIDARRGRVLQIFAYAQPRPPGLIPQSPGGFAPSGPSYASREPFGGPAGAEPSPNIREVPRRAEEKPKRHTKTATRETVPHHEAKPVERSPAAATAPPAHEPQPASEASKDKAAPPPSVPVKAAIAPAAPAPATPAQPAAAQASPDGKGSAPAGKSVNKPGYANGVPINPLD